jgi:hypothetical protein
MRRFRVVLCACLLAAGCAAEGGRGFLDDALKDWNGDNQRMRSDAQWNDLPAPPPAPPRR